jgi:uncharacterized delta-60 repeat protein
MRSGGNVSRRLAGRIQDSVKVDGRRVRTGLESQFEIAFQKPAPIMHVGSDKGDVLNELSMKCPSRALHLKNGWYSALAEEFWRRYMQANHKRTRAVLQAWRTLVGLLLFANLAGFAEASGDLVIDSLGRIVTAGSTGRALLLARYNSDGSPDASLGSNGGLVITDVAGADVGGSAIALDRLGRIVVAGVSQRRVTSYYDTDFLLDSDFLLTRYNSDGSLDTSFGNGGLVITDLSGGSSDWLRAVVIDSLGRIVVTGSTTPLVRPGAATHPSIALARYTSEGLLDASFGNGGIVTTDIDGRASGARGVDIDNLGRITVAGYSYGGITLARYNSDGSLDSNFGNANGVEITNIGDSGAATVAIDSLGRIVAAGAVYTSVGASGKHFSFALARCNSDGTLDASFGNGGIVTTHISGDGPGRDDSVVGIIIDSLGRIVAVGGCPWDCGKFDFELARYNSDGALDAAFGNGGIVTTHFGVTGSQDSAGAVSMDSLGRLVVVGNAEDDSVLVRYNPDGSLDNTFRGAPLPVVWSLRFDRSSVFTGSSYSAIFSGSNLTDETFFDVLFTAPGSNDSVVALNWQKGLGGILGANHSVPAGITSGSWTINGVRAHNIETDHSGNFFPVAARITVVFLQ